ncbi:50S ribosomal protein L30 [Candidatus Riesia sp. GBBU]|nr:50S ribosomal protein L30 [Candidatus Riesia sp. GBBU]
MKKYIEITQFRSEIGRLPKHKSTLVCLGLKHIGHTVILQDTKSVRDMVKKISYMVKINE